MQNYISFSVLSRATLLLLAISTSLSIEAEIIPSDEDIIRSQPNLDDKLELYRFIRGVKNHFLQQNEQQIPEQQRELQREHQINYETARNDIESNSGRSSNRVAAQEPVFSQQAESGSRRENESFGYYPPSSSGFDLPPPSPSRASSSRLSSSSSSSSSPSSSSGHSSHSKYSPPSHHPTRFSKTPTSTVTTTKYSPHNQDQSQVAHLREVRIRTIPLTEAVNYSNYVVVPSQSARLEESSGSASSSSSSSSRKSSSSSSTTTTQEESAVVLAPPPTSTTTTFVSAPLLAPAPDCTPTLLQRLTVVRPVESTLVVKVPSSVSSSESSSQLVEETTKEVAEPPAVVPPICCVVEKKVAPIMAAKLIVPPKPSGLTREEHFHSETRSSREHSNGLGGLVSSSSSSSSSSRSSKSSSTSSSQTSAALMAPVPVVTKTVTTVIRQPAPTVTIRASPLIALAPVKESSGRTNNYSVDVDHHYSGPNVKYGYSIRQQSSEPETKGTLVGDQVVYLKRK